MPISEVMHAQPPEKPIVDPQQGGVSLVELLVGIGVAVLLVAGALTGVAQHQAQRRMHGEMILAMSACRNTLEELRAVDIGDLPTYDGRGFDILGQNGEANGLPVIEGDADGLAGQISVTAHSSSATGNELYVVQARVHWQGATRQGNFVMETLMGERR